MPTYVRVILVPAHLNLYERGTLREVYGLDDSEYHPDILDDYRTNDGELSLFEFDLQQQSVELIVCALAAQSTNCVARGYFLIDDGFFSALGFPAPQKKNGGNTASPTIDETHYNIQLGTTQRRLELAHAIVDKCVPETITTDEMEKYLVDYYHEGELPYMHKSLKKKLGLDLDEGE